jgi:predicted alpha/beta-fold hydrolase
MSVFIPSLVKTGVLTYTVPGGGVPLTTEQTYSAGYTDDIRTALLYITDKYPRAPIIAVGFSLGANALAKYVGEEGDQCRLRAACALGCVSVN